MVNRNNDYLETKKKVLQEKEEKEKLLKELLDKELLLKEQLDKAKKQSEKEKLDSDMNKK